MKRILAHKIEIYPNNKAITYFVMCFGVARFAYNWALQICKKSLADKEKVPSGYDLSKLLNSIKREQYPWMYGVSKWVVQKSLYNLAEAFQRFFKKTSRFPKFKKRGVCRDSFYTGVGCFTVSGNHIKLPNIGWIRMSQGLRFPGKLLSVVISRTAGRFFASIQVEVDDTYVYPHACESQASVGVDLGVKDLVVLSDGQKFSNPKVLRYYERKLKRLQRQLSREQKGSKNRLKAKGILSRLHFRIRNIRRDYIHKLTSYLVENFLLIGIEDLNIAGMMKNHKLAKSISDASFCEIKRQLVYKSLLSGSRVEIVGRFFPSSKQCSVCGFRNENLTLSDRTWCCKDCGVVHDRDINAARNILKVAQGHWETKNACGEGVRLPRLRARGQSLMKQEGGISC
ncbi:MAG: transposase [Dehalococcoidales bacterium]|nr:transposase [Dehalococcoidales bacterium]